VGGPSVVDSPAVSGSLLSFAARRGLAFASVGKLLRWRATLPTSRNRPFILWDDETWTYEQAYRESMRFARLFADARQAAVARGELSHKSPLGVGIYQDNSPSFLFACFGAALSGDLVFGFNTGFRGDTLAAVIDRAEARVLLTSPEHLEQLEMVLDDRPTLRRDQVLVDASSAPQGMRTLDDALPRSSSLDDGGLSPEAGDPMIVIYTSGTTGVPKGIACSHLKLLGAGAVTSLRIKLKPSDRGYICMPLFHSNAWLLGIMPLLVVGGSMLVKPKFSASAFEEDILRYGVTFMNYVGQPLHYILAALEKKHGSPAAVEAALARHPDNHFRIMHGNGAPAVDRQKMVRYLGMEHVYELYGSTEAVISTVVKPGDPLDSVGAVGKKVVILDEQDRECPPAEVDASGRILNYDQAVGEISAKIDEDNIFFDGYYRDDRASQNKYRGGYYRSGDLGHIRAIGRKRYLYFDGRTDDWIRKDGENFSAETVAAFADDHPGVAIAAAYGVPAPVADERVMVALQLQSGASFDPQATFDRFVEQQEREGMDPKWFPDFVRIEEQLPLSPTQKVLVRHLKREHFDVRNHPDMIVYFRERGDTTFKRFGVDDYDRLRREFEENGRERLLDH